MTMNQAVIVDVDRNPRIAGTRITVYTIFEFVQAGWRPADIAFWFDLKRAQVDAAICFIDENKDRVAADYAKIMERINRGNPPELQAKLAAVEGTAARLREVYRARKQGSPNEGHSSGQ
jgi:uncharacterized protein (DUF433 family)